MLKRQMLAGNKPTVKPWPRLPPDDEQAPLSMAEFGVGKEIRYALPLLRLLVKNAAPQ